MMRLNFAIWCFTLTGIVFTRPGFAQSPGAGLDTLSWSPKGINIRLKDELKHPSFSWPLSQLTYPVNFAGTGVLARELMLRDLSSGKAIPFQLLRPVVKNGRIQRAVLSFLAALPSGGDQTFRLSDAKSASAATEFLGTVKVQKTVDGYLISNGKIRIELPLAQNKAVAPIKRYGNAKQWLGYGALSVALPLHRMSVVPMSVGPIETTYQIRYVFAGNKVYTLNVRLIAQMEYVELEEKMIGFSLKDSLQWKMVWDGLSLDHRYVPTRAEQLDRKGKGYANINWEPMEGLPAVDNPERHPQTNADQRNKKDGELPFRIAPYDNWLSWWRLPVAAFWSEKINTSIGIFIKDMELWDDGLYALWGSKKDLNIRFHWNNNQLDYTFPLVNGSRSTALAAYSHQKDKDLVDQTNVPLVYIDELRRWNGWIPLDKVKHWVLNYQEREAPYPRYFKPENTTSALTLPNLENSLFNNLKVIANGGERINGPTPVGSRVYYDLITPAFDLKANEMSAAQYQKLRAWFLFVSYLYMDEALMPMRNLLSGHPNFLADVKGVPGLAAFLFPKHPGASEMSNHFEKAVQLNYRYHVRPEVQAWEAKGGRWTENLATYTWAALTPTIRSSFLLHHSFDGKNRLLQPGISNFGNWLLNAATAPLDALAGRRVYPPQGAHAHAYEGGPPNALRLLGQELADYDPLLNEHLLWFTSASDSPFESTNEKNKAWTEMLQGDWKNNTGTNPHLRSSKYTGYGFILRSDFGTKDEMYVNLQQIDEGPNYRWGRAAMGGNGAIYYYAGGKRYSHNGPEDVGDGPFGDTERISNFGVQKVGVYRSIGSYRSVGRNDLTEPLYDFGFAQFASILGNPSIASDYQSRSVLQSGSDYIAIYDQVGKPETQGRFSWFVGKADEFPAIYQLKPGVTGIDAAIQPSQSNYHKDGEVLPTKGRYYTGKGDFLTIVSHKPGIKVEVTPFGCRVSKNNGDTDLIFRDSKPIDYNNTETGITFKGTAGIVRKSGNMYSGAVFSGSAIRIPGISIDLGEGMQEQAGFSVQTTVDGFAGTFQSRSSLPLVFSSSNPGLIFYLDGIPLAAKGSASGRVAYVFPAGKHDWQWRSNGVKPAATSITGTLVKSGAVALNWKAIAGAESYRIEMSQDGGRSWTLIREGIKDTHASVTGLQNEVKIHLRVIVKGQVENSEPCAEYPVYVTAAVPHCPEGLHIEDLNHAELSISWGSILGAGNYRLYRGVKKTSSVTDYVQVYQGKDTFFRDHKPPGKLIYTYVVRAENGNGQSSYSSSADTDPNNFLNWQPKKSPGFIRDTENHENGYLEFDPFVEDQQPILAYPNNQPIKEIK